MKCIVEQIEKETKYQFGEPREIIVDTIPFEKNGHHGHTYSFHMSTERYERSNRRAYNIYLEDDQKVASKEESQKKESKQEIHKGTIKLATMGYYDFIDFSYEDCISDRMIENVAKQFEVPVSEVEEAIHKTLKDLQRVIREEFSRTDEAIAKKEHEAIIQKHQKARHDYSMQYGFPPVEYDRCYNVFGQLMDAEYLGHLNEILEKRENMKRESKRYRKSESQKRFHEYLHSSTSVNYSEKEQLLLSKFYKVLAKKYHPDANPGIDTSEEMTLLNKVKKDWGV